jgi:hypothetical protein
MIFYKISQKLMKFHDSKQLYDNEYTSIIDIYFYEFFLPFKP